jgi:hypothetical protein
MPTFAAMQENGKVGSNRPLAAGCSKVRFGPFVSLLSCPAIWAGCRHSPQARNLMLPAEEADIQAFIKAHFFPHRRKAATSPQRLIIK